MIAGRSTQRRMGGFTLVELIVSVAVAAVLIGVGVPAFNGFLAQQRLTTQLQDFVMAVALARSEAMNRRVDVFVQANDSADDANEWGPGWCVSTVTDCEDEVVEPLRTFPPLDTATLDGTDDLDTIGTITFDARGVMDPPDGDTFTLALCAINEDVVRGRSIDISMVGRTSLAEIDCGEEEE